MSDDDSAQDDRPASLPPWASLRYRDYSFLFMLALFAVSAQQMRLAQNLYQVYEISGSAFLLGMTGLAQGVPIFALGLFGGTLADFLDRKKILLITTFGNLIVAIALGVLTLTGLIQVWHILAGTAITSALNIVLNPTRMALISHLVPRSHLTNAVALNSSVSQGSHFIGPMLGGLSLAWMSTGNAYLFNALFYIPAAIAVVLLKTPAVDKTTREKFSMASYLGGVKFLFSEPIILTLVMLDFIVVGFGYYRPLLPIFAKDILFVGPAGFGMLSSAPAIGGVHRHVRAARDRRREEQRPARFVVFSPVRGGIGSFRDLDKFRAVAFIAWRHGFGEFAPGRHAPDELSSPDARSRARPRVFRFQYVFPRRQRRRRRRGRLYGRPPRRAGLATVRLRGRWAAHVGMLAGDAGAKTLWN